MFKGGRFYQRNRVKRSSIRRKEDVLDQIWVDKGPYPHDVTCLLLNLVMYQLAVLASLDARLFMSISGKSIYVAVKADQTDLERMAESVGYEMQLSIGGSDLVSLEPCNGQLYPMRFIEVGDERVGRLHEELGKFFKLVDSY